MPVPLRSRILLADDHELVRSGLKMVLDSQPDLEVVAEASDGEEALKIAISAEIDLAVLDVSMPRLTGLAGRGRASPQSSRASHVDALGPRQRAVLL